MGKRPKAFISYAWTNEKHEEWVMMIAKKLRSHGVDVAIDKWDLKEGYDLYVFMEQMVKSPDIDKVLIICDRLYSEKADLRYGGVGAETIIATQEVYRDVKQEKFIPIVVEKDTYGNPYVPTYLKTRMYIDMADKSNFDKSYERLLRNIYNLPKEQKPPIGDFPYEILGIMNTELKSSIFEFSKDIHVEFENSKINSNSNQTSRLDTKKPIVIKQIENVSRIGDECIANVTFHPTEDCIAYSLDTRLMVYNMNKPFANVIGDHTINDKNIFLNNFLKDKKLKKHEKDIIHSSLDYTGIGEYVSKFLVPITDIAFSTNGELIATVDRNGYLALWYYKVGEIANPLIIQFKAHDDAISSLRFSPNSNILATASFDETIKIWNINNLLSHNTNPIKIIMKNSNKKAAGRYRHEKEHITALAFSSKGDFLASGDETGRVKIRDAYTNCKTDIVYMNYLFNYAVTDIKFSTLNDNIIIASSADSRIRVLRKDKDWGKPETLGVKEEKHKGSVNSIALSYDGRILISSGGDSLIKIWDIDSKELIMEYNTGHNDSIHKVAFCPNTNKAASDSVWDSIKLWELTNDGYISNTTVDIQKQEN